MMALLGLRDAVGNRAEVSPGGEEREVFWWTKGTLRDELRPCVKARTKDPPSTGMSIYSTMTIHVICFCSVFPIGY